MSFLWSPLSMHCVIWFFQCPSKEWGRHWIHFPAEEAGKQISCPDSTAGAFWLAGVLTWPGFLTPGPWCFSCSVPLTEHQLFSDSFILAMASSWAYHCPHTCYQKLPCKCLLHSHLALKKSAAKSRGLGFFPNLLSPVEGSGGPLWIRTRHPPGSWVWK